MPLNTYAAELRRSLFDDLLAGRAPSTGDFDAALLAEAKVKGAPQVGATRYAPDAIAFEFIYPDVAGSTIVFTVTVAAPERIVFLPVPEWVIESIWQGDIDGSYHFESDARRLVDGLVAQLEPDDNLKWFGPRQAKRRE